MDAENQRKKTHRWEVVEHPEGQCEQDGGGDRGLPVAAIAQIRKVCGDKNTRQRFLASYAL